MSIKEDKVLVFDLDGTLCEIDKNKKYEDLLPIKKMVEKLLEYKKRGYWIIIQTARQMKTYQGNVGMINANTSKVTIQWLEKHNIPFDEIHFGKPWCGRQGFYIDDKAIRPNEFYELSEEELKALINKEEKHD